MTGWTIERYEVVQSTQDVARERLTDGRVIVAAWQRAGRGRHGRPWSAPPGRALLFSAVLAPAGPVAAILPLLAGVAVRDAIASTAGVAAELKWPNDVLSDGAKVAGILVERPPGPFAVLGVGINANLEAVDLPGDWATSLLIRTGHPVDLDALLAATLEQLDQWLERAASAGIDVIVNAWRERTRMLGQPVEVVLPDRTVRGIAEDVTGSGALLVRSPSGVETFIAGDVRQLRIR
ncbi:MAG: biotin--[acetyl-CoA-carboxylase] ligase [Chloroflexi bacterium]|nr:MAG: biotin--[acetyl-CoA-carboxylase] ligase [Chloroflexota bacterium]